MQCSATMVQQVLCRRLHQAASLLFASANGGVHPGHLTQWPHRLFSSTQAPDAGPDGQSGTQPSSTGTNTAGNASGSTQLMRHLQTKIMMRGGPISLAEYMQEALTSPHGGFYTSGDVFGTQGHFTTSPEISQMFGEMIGAWLVHTWSTCLGSPSKVSLVELGPGRGTLMADILRATARFKPFASAVHVHMVEVSAKLQARQWEVLRCHPSPSTAPSQPHKDLASVSRQQPASGLILPPDFKPTAAPDATSIQGEGVRHGICGFNHAPVTWHHVLDSVPRDVPALFVAHEFFDALPVHQFVKDPSRGWLEKLVDVVHAAESSGQGQQGSDQQVPSPPASPHQASDKLRFVLSPSGTPAAALLVNRRLQGMTKDEADKIDAVEVSAHGMAIAETLAVRIADQGGAALVIDYGQDGHYKDSLMAIRHHKGVPVLDEPGSADLSIWVDFAALRQAAVGSERPVAVSGPVTQASFLLQLGMQQRLEQLRQRATPEQAHHLETGFHRLTDDKSEQGMGGTYKMMAITPANAPLPVGFDGGPLVGQLQSEPL